MMFLTCSSAKKIISDSIDGGCSPEQSASLELHLKNCPACRRLLEDFQTIKNGAKDLQALEPSGTIWLKIRARLSEQMGGDPLPMEKRRRWGLSPAGFRGALSTLLVLVVAVGGMFLGSRIWKGQNSLVGPENGKVALAKLEEAEHHYQQAIMAIREAFAVQKGEIDPQVLAVFRKNMALIDDSLEACRELVLEDPGNIESRNYLLAMYKEKIDLLAEMINVQDKTSQPKETKTTI